MGDKGDFADASSFFADFENQLELRNPGAGATIRQEYPGVSLKELGECLGSTIPNVIAKAYTPAGSSNVINAQLMDIEQAMRRAVMSTLSSAPRPATAAVSTERWRPEELRLQHEVLSLLLQSENHRAERANILQRRAEVEQQLAAQSSSPNEGLCAQPEPEPEWATT